MKTGYMLNMRTAQGEWCGYYRCDEIPELGAGLNTHPPFRLIGIGEFDRKVDEGEIVREMWHVTVARCR